MRRANARLSSLLLVAAAAHAQRGVHVTGKHREGTTGEFTVRILHVSDTHHVVGGECLDLDVKQLAFGNCSGDNTTKFLRSLIETEQPDIITYIGDVIDEKTAGANGKPQVGDLEVAMDDIYNLASDRGIPLAASLGNHEDGLAMPRDDILSHIANLPQSLTMYGPVPDSPGNFFVDVHVGGDQRRRTAEDCVRAKRHLAKTRRRLRISRWAAMRRVGLLASEERAAAAASMDGELTSALEAVTACSGGIAMDELPAARLVFFDSRQNDDPVRTITDDQVAWFRNLADNVPAAPTLAFYHAPLPEYVDSVGIKWDERMFGVPVPENGTKILGWRDQIKVGNGSRAVFAALRDAGVLAGFCGHDHANDFCAKHDGVSLCFVGSQGYTANGACYRNGKLASSRLAEDDEGPPDECIPRRARVTELVMQPHVSGPPRLRAIRSWLRVDKGGSLASPSRYREEVLWASE